MSAGFSIDDVDGASGVTAAAPTEPAKFSVEDAEDKPASSGAATEPPKERSLWENIVAGASAPGRALLDALIAGPQGTSPMVRGAGGKLNYEPGGEDEQKFYDETGVPRDATKFVVLPHPDTGKMTVWKRSEDMNEGGATGLGRVLTAGMLAPATAPIVAAAGAPSRAASLVADFERHQVPASIPAVTQNRAAGIAQNVLHNVPGASGSVEHAAEAGIEATGEAAERAAAQYGAASNAKQAGDTVQQGVRNFAKPAPEPGGAPGESEAITQLKQLGVPQGTIESEVIKNPTRLTSFNEKSGALFDRFDRNFAPTDPVAVPKTIAALNGPIARFPSSPELGAALTNPWLAKIGGIVQRAGASLTFPEVQELRSTIGRLLDPSNSLVSDIPRADLKKVYAALSTDLEAAAGAKGPAALRQWQVANRYYSAGIDRLETLDKFLGKSPEGAYGAVLQAAQDGTKGDIGKLLSLRRAMPDEQWNDIAAATIKQMGRPRPANIDPLQPSPPFSPATFVTNYERLSPAGKTALFGADELRNNLDSLVRVAAAEKNVAKLANSSKTAAHGGMLAVAGGFIAEPITTTLSLIGGNIGARLMMSPRFVKWLYTAPQAARGGAPGITAHVAKLDQIARQSPELAPGLAQIGQAATARLPPQDQ